MPIFSYNTLGQADATGVIEAPDRAAAVRLLRQRGVTPVRVDVAGESTSRRARGAKKDEAGTETKAGAGKAIGGRVMSRTEMASFISELATALQAGLNLTQTLRTAAMQGRNPRQKAMIEFLIREVEHGRSFSQAAESWGKPFSELTINLIRAGEASGRLGEVLEQAAVLLDRDVKLRRQLLSATTYPMILTVLVSVAVLVMVTVIVPTVLKPLAGQIRASDLPFPTRVVQGVAAIVGSYWWLLIGGAAMLGLLWTNMYRQAGPRLAIDGAILKIPVVGRLARDVAVARFTRTLGTLVSSGLPALSALKITKATLGNKAMEAVLEDVCQQVASGKTIAEPMERGKVFPPLLVQIVSIGERSGRLPQMLTRAADALESRTEASIKLFTSLLPPVLVVGLACVVGFVVAAIFLALLQVQEFVK